MPHSIRGLVVLLLACALLSGCASYTAPIPLNPQIPIATTTKGIPVQDVRAPSNPSRLDPAFPRERVVGQWLTIGIVLSSESASELVGRILSARPGVKTATLRSFDVSSVQGLWASTARASIVLDAKMSDERELRVAAIGENLYVQITPRNFEIAVERAGGVLIWLRPK